MTSAPDAPEATRASKAAVLTSAFVASLGPMVTVPALRRLVMEAHGGSAAHLHLFVALGMLGGAVGAPLLARRADRGSNTATLAMALALVDAVIGALTAAPIPTYLLYCLRPIHGAASMGLLAILFAQFPRREGSGLSRVASATIVALAVGPALGGFLAKHGYAVPFRLASALDLALVPLLFIARRKLSAGRAEKTTERTESMANLAGVLVDPLVILGTQRMAIGGLVATWAIRARETFQMSDAKVGASFSAFLLAFAATTLVGGKRMAERSALVTCGGMTLGGAFVGLAFAPRPMAFALLALAGVGAALAYAPSLARIAQLSTERTRVSGMALAHSAGAAGMILGPIAGAAFDRLFGQLQAPLRASAFLCVVGIVHAIASVALSPYRRNEGSARLASPSLKEDHRTI